MSTRAIGTLPYGEEGNDKRLLLPYLGGSVISIAQMAAGRMYIDAR
jgi:hypothetical protein